MKKILSLALTAVMLLSMLSLIPFSTSAAAWDGTTATEFTGKGTASDPYIIASAENLKYLQKMVADGEDYRGEYFTQTADIDLNGKEWTPIGDSGMYFSGVYDGLGHEIKGLFISDGTLTYCGLFGYITSDYNNETGIMNLKLSGEIKIDNLEKDAGIGALCGWVYKDSADSFKIEKIYNITNNVNITINANAKQPRLGAVLGYAFNAEVFNVVNNGNIDYIGSAHTRIGGIVGQTNRTHYKNCVNNGNLTATVTGTASSQIGGMSGMTTYKLANVETEFDHCVNNGKITMVSENGHCMGAGIVGSLYSSGTELFLNIHDCINNGAVSAKMTATDETACSGKYAYAAGICPRLNVGTDTIINNVNTSLDITSESITGDQAAGIISGITAGTAENVKFENNVTPTTEVCKTSVFELNQTKNFGSATDKDLKTRTAPIMAEVNAAFKAVINDYPSDKPVEETTAKVEETKAPETEAKTEAVTTVAEEPTQAPADETTAAPEVTTEAPAAKSGCGSVVSLGVALVAVLGSAIVFKKH